MPSCRQSQQVFEIRGTTAALDLALCGHFSPNLPYLGRAIAKRRAHLTSTLRQMSLAQYTQFCNTFATALEELADGLDYKRGVFLEACRCVSADGNGFVPEPIFVKPLGQAVHACELQRCPLLVRIGRTVAKVFPERF